MRTAWRTLRCREECVGSIKRSRRTVDNAYRICSAPDKRRYIGYVIVPRFPSWSSFGVLITLDTAPNKRERYVISILYLLPLLVWRRLSTRRVRGDDAGGGVITY